MSAAEQTRGMRVAVAGLWVAAVLFALVGTATWIAIGCAAVATISLFVRAKVTIGRVPQLIGLPVAAGLGYGASLAFAAPRVADGSGLGTTWFAVATAPLIYAAARQIVAEPLFGTRGQVMLTWLSVAGCGGARDATFYLAFAALAVTLGLWAMRPERTTSFRPSHAITALVACAIATGFVYGLPPAQSSAMKAGFDFIEGGISMSGFSGQIKLGSPGAKFSSDRIVMRVFGPKTDHLRGEVYDVFDNGRWFRARADTSPALAAQPHDGTRVRIELEDPTKQAFFVPRAAGDVRGATKPATRDSLGLWRPTAPDDNGDVSFVTTAGPPVPGPTEADGQVPPPLRPALAAIVTRWTHGIEPPGEQLREIERHLSADYTYSLSARKPAKSDPVIDFLENQKFGHCEFFASAMALLARTSSVPARVVGGFRVAEENRFGGYRVVRERHAHAWVEAYVDGAWVTFDPSPLDSDAPEAAASATAAFIDAAVRFVLTHRGRIGAIIGGLVLLIIVGVLGWRRWRDRPVRDREPSVPARPTVSEPFDALMSALADRGANRRPSETLIRFASRIDDPSVKVAIEAYAAHRYGRIGDASVIEQALNEARRAVSADRR